MTALLILLAWLALAVVCAAVFAFGVQVGERRCREQVAAAARERADAADLRAETRALFVERLRALPQGRRGVVS